MELADQVTEFEGRFYWAWQQEHDRVWTAPTPSIGGRYVGPKSYVCSGAAVSRSRRRDLVRWLRREVIE